MTWYLGEERLKLFDGILNIRCDLAQGLGCEVDEWLRVVDAEWWDRLCWYNALEEGSESLVSLKGAGGSGLGEGLEDGEPGLESTVLFNQALSASYKVGGAYALWRLAGYWVKWVDGYYRHVNLLLVDVDTTTERGATEWAYFDLSELGLNLPCFHRYLLTLPCVTG